MSGAENESAPNGAINEAAPFREADQACPWQPVPYVPYPVAPPLTEAEIRRIVREELERFEATGKCCAACEAMPAEPDLEYTVPPQWVRDRE